MISAVIFDMDGLMVDTEALYSRAVIGIVKKRNREFTQKIKQEMMGRLGIESMRILKERLSLAESPEELLSERAIIYDRLLKAEGAKPMPGLYELLDLLDSLKIPYAIASSSKRIWVDFIMESLKIKQRFVSILSGEDIKNGKPDPEIYTKSIEILRKPKEKCLVLEDALSGVIAGKRAGAKCIAVRNEFNKDLDFKDADLVLESLKDITKEVLEKI
ncbi:MAG: HAD family phosphatase [bacterium]